MPGLHEAADPLAIRMGKGPAVDLGALTFILNLGMLQVVPYFGNLHKLDVRLAYLCLVYPNFGYHASGTSAGH
jgi:hypothetical protein